MHKSAILLLAITGLLALNISPFHSAAQDKRLQERGAQLRSYDLLTLDPTAVAEQVRRTGELSISTSNRTFDLMLSPYDIRSENYRSQINTNPETSGRGQSFTFKGTVRNLPGAQARFTLDGSVVEGMIITPEGKYFIEAAGSSPAQTNQYVLYKESDVVSNDALICPDTLAGQVNGEVSRIKSSGSVEFARITLDAVSPTREVELATEADNEYVAALGSESAANNQILSIVNMVDGIYQSEIGLTFKVVFQRAWSATDPYSDTTDVVALLNEFRAQWNNNPPAGAPARDLVHMWTGKNTNAAGFGFTGDLPNSGNAGIVCRDAQFAKKGGSVSYSLSRRTGSLNSDVIIPAHEIGHNFGATHPDLDNPSHPECALTIMNSDATNSLQTFCQYSRDQITNYINASSGTPPTPNNNCLAVATTAPPKLQFSTDTYRAVEETDRSVVITVTRSSGNGVSTVDYETVNQSASERTDFTTARGTLVFAGGETQKSFEVFITNDVYVEGSETFGVLLSAPTGGTLGTPSAATVTIVSGDAVNGSSPVRGSSFDADFFVRMHYLDFFSRQADGPGLAFWTGQTTGCGNPDLAGCRINVSAAFFLSIEFQETGFYVIRVHRVAFGRRSDTAASRVTYNELISASHKVAENLVVGQPGWQQVLDSNKLAYAQAVVGSSSFIARFPANQAAATYVDALFASAGVTPGGSDRQNAINAFGGGDFDGRVNAFRSVVDSDSVRQAEINAAFVLMQYFGYLRRNPTDLPNTDDSGYQFWFGKLNQFNGNFQAAEMVKAFITSDEYINRFGN